MTMATPATSPHVAHIPRTPNRDALRTLDVLGVRITDATIQAAVTLMEGLIRLGHGRARSVYIVNAHTLNVACDQPDYRAVLNSGDVVFADGIGVRLAARLQGVRLSDNLVGTDLLPAFFKATADRAYRYFLLGGRPGTATRAVATLGHRFPGIRIVGHLDGYSHASDTGRIVSTINKAGPDMLLVGMGNPKQERWIAAHLPVLRVPLSIGVGGLFDHWAGHLRRAPRWIRAAGLEWTQILMQQPHKWRRYILGNPMFVARIVRQRVDRRR